MKKSDFKNKPAKDLIKALLEKREDLRKIRFGTTHTKTRNVKESANTRKDIARILTELKATKLVADKK